MALKASKESGTDQKNFFIKHKIVTFLVIVFVIGIIVVISGGGNNNTIKTDTKVEQSQEKLNLEKFNKIETGMTYEQVVEIIGEEGTVLSESEIGDIKTTIYSWYGKGSIGANANITFQKGKVISKAQFGLK